MGVRKTEFNKTFEIAEKVIERKLWEKYLWNWENYNETFNKIL